MDKVSEKSEQSLNSLVKEYVSLRLQQLPDSPDEKTRQEWIHISHVMDVAQLDQLMTQDFDFKHYYCEYGKYEVKELASIVKKRANAL